MEKLQDFIFTTCFKLKDIRAMEKLQKLLELELSNFDDLSSRIHDLCITLDDPENLKIQFHANDFTSYKIVVSSIMRYIEIIEKTMELVQD
ncbi:MAG TPA: KEOPS complex subunit Pcc1 [Candidatus Lokiarchaeia archaeon]|nr:KEOPS complex subunit Pcc1 [Candidatus Lokiarchaeia archaeon]